MADFPPDDTIAAISTPPGEGGIGIVRLSGPRAVAIAERIFYSPSGMRPGMARSRSLLYGFARDPETGSEIDEVLLAVMRAPRTYTREDVVEINCHGGAAASAMVLKAALFLGARAAGPGEFTKRAFLNGRIDLSQAEAALDLIRASTEEAGRLALRQLRGGLSEKINSIMADLVGACAHVEAHIDFPEDEIEPSDGEGLREKIGRILADTRALAESYLCGRYYREGLRVAIVGRPNVGKSSLLNALLMRERAIVTELPGTTRDTVEGHMEINGLPVLIIDTAGIREAHDMAESEGVKRSLRAMDEADVVVAVFEAGGPLRAEDHNVLGRIRGKNAVAAINKSDLLHGPMQAPEGIDPGSSRAIFVSARTGEGLGALKEAVCGLALGGRRPPAEGIAVTNLRHRVLLEAAAQKLSAAIETLGREPIEITALELRDALDRLGGIVGAVTADQVLDRIFAEFCIGK